LYETRGNATNCGMIYYYKYLTKIKITSWWHSCVSAML
jgi:hypothetical protein